MARNPENSQIGVYQNVRDSTTRFEQHYSGGKITLIADNGRLVCRESDDTIQAFGTYVADRCRFEETSSGHPYVTLKADNGKYLCPEYPTMYLKASGYGPCHFYVE